MSPCQGGVPRRGEGVLFVRGSRPTSLSGRKPPLIPPYQGGKSSPPVKGEYPEGGRGFVCSGEPPCFPIGKKTPLNPPLSGGQKALPLRGRLASLSGMEPHLDPPLSGRFVAVVPLTRGIPPKGGGGFVCSGEPPYFPIGKETPLDPPLSGGQKALPLRGRPTSLSGSKPPLSGERIYQRRRVIFEKKPPPVPIKNHAHSALFLPEN